MPWTKTIFDRQRIIKRPFEVAGAKFQEPFETRSFNQRMASRKPVQSLIIQQDAVRQCIALNAFVYLSMVTLRLARQRFKCVCFQIAVKDQKSIPLKGAPQIWVG